MAKDLPDYMREFDTADDWGFTPVTSKPESSKPSIDPKVVERMAKQRRSTLQRVFEAAEAAREDTSMCAVS